MNNGRPKADEFGRVVARMAVAQICESVGFQGFKESALDSLTDIAIRYICDLGKTSAYFANLAGRTQCNVFDVVRGFEDLGISLGFMGASNSSDCIVDSDMVKQAIEFVGRSEEIPFAQPVPRFPVIRDRSLIPSFETMGENPPGKHIPAWLPALPDPHTYMHTPMWSERVDDPRADKIDLARQRRKAERALLSLQQRLLSNGSVGASSSSGVVNEAVKELGISSGNQSSSSMPLEAGNKDTSVVAAPGKLKSNVSAMEAFASAIEEAKESGMLDDGEVERKTLPDKRPAVTFKLKTGKKLLGQSLDLCLLRRCGRRTGPLLGRDDERDDRKRRAEFILRQAMENPQDLTQL